MNDLFSSALTPLPLPLDRICDSFEAAWKAALTGGARPRVEGFLAGATEPERQTLLIELLSLEAGYRRRLGETFSLQEYRQRFPDLSSAWMSQQAKHDTEEMTTAEKSDAASVPDASSTFRPSAFAPQPLSFMGKFELLERLGMGSFGAVWKARDSELDRIVALKIPHSGHLMAGDELERFQREARAAAQLRHPTIVCVYEVTTLNGVPAIVAEYVPGMSLKDLLAKRRLTFLQSAALIAQLADALEYAHSLGVVHRDVKPANIMLLQGESGLGDGASGTAQDLSEIGKPKILDFGLALRDASETTLTMDGQLLGTPAYMSPEQAAGLGHKADRRSDVYSLGVVLFQMLTGELPFRGSRLTLLDQVLREEPRSPRKLDHGVPRDLETICLKCLHKEADKRYGTALELAEELRRFQRGEPILARPVGRLEQVWRWCRRSPGWAAMFASLATLLLVIAVGSSVGVVLLQQALTKSEDNRLRAVDAESDAQGKLWGSYLEKARALRMSQRRGQRFDSLQAVRMALTLPLPAGRSVDELRNEAASALLLPDIEFVREREMPPTIVETNLDGTIPASFDAALERYSRPERGGDISVRRVADDVEIARVKGNGDKVEARLSPNGQLLVVRDAKTNRLTVWRLRDADPEMICEQAFVGMLGVISADNQRLACRRLGGTIRVVTLADGKATDWPEKAPGARDLQFNPDGSRLTYFGRVDQKDILCVHDVPTGAVLARLPHPKSINWQAWHPAGHFIATAGDDFRIRLWNTTTWRAVELEGHKALGMRCVFAWEGDRLISTDWHGLLRIWDVYSGRLLFTTSAPTHMLSSMSQDGQLALQVENKIAIFHIAGGREFRTLPYRPASGPGAYASANCAAVLSPDGRFLAVMTEEGTCSLVDPRTGAELGLIPLKPTYPFAFETSGALLTFGSAGLCRWPVQTEPGISLCRVGPPQLLFRLPSQVNAHASSADGRVVAVANRQKGALLFTVRETKAGPPLVLGPQEDVRSCAVSPNGRWVATGNHWNTQGIGAKIWDAGSGLPVKDLPVKSGGCSVRFSPDDRWLATSSVEGTRLREVGTWEEKHVLEAGGFVFSPDSQMLAVESEAGVIRLFEPESGKRILRLEAPEQKRLLPLAFTPDGGQLIALGNDSQALHIWDLRAVRRQLKTLHLDWQGQEYPPEPSAARLRIEVILAAK